MFTRLTPRGTGKALAYVGTGISLGLVSMQLGCTNSNKAFETPSPNISSFLICQPKQGTWDSTATRTVNIAKGGTVLIRANFATTGGTALITPGNLTPTTNGIITLNGITSTTVYTLTVTSAKGEVSTSTVTATVLPAPSNLTYAVPDATYYKDVFVGTNAVSVTGGGTYTYSVTPALPAGMTLDATSGAISGAPQAMSSATAYTVTAVDSVGQSTTGTVSIKVLATPVTFTESVRAVVKGDSATLTWDATSVAGLFKGATLTANPADATLPATIDLAGSITVTPTATTTYTLSLTPAAGGAPVTRTLGLTVGSGPFSFVDFKASPAVTEFDGSSVLTWDYLNTPDTLTLDGADVLSLTSKTVSPIRRQTYTLTGGNALNTTNATITTAVAAKGFDLLAGSTAGPGYLDGTGATARFGLNSAAISGTTAASMNLSVDPSDNIYVADSLLANVRMISPTGVVTTLAGKAGVPWINTTISGDGSGNGTAARFKNPAHVLYVDANTLYVTDYYTNSVRKLAKQGDGSWTVSTFAGTVGTYGDSSKQLLDDPLCSVLYNGKLYIASAYDSSIRIFDPAAAAGSQFTVLAGGNGAASYGLKDATGSLALFRTLSSMAIDPANGTLYVADRENHAIRQVTQAGVVTTIAGAYPTATAGNVDGSGLNARFARPAGIVRASNGTLFVADNNNHTIRKMVYNAGTSAWDVTTIAGTGVAGYKEGAGTQAAFNGPEGITLDSAGNLYVADAVNALIRKLTPSADATPVYTTSPFAGSRDSGTTDETIATARFYNPNGVAVDANNTIYIADEANDVVRKITPDGTVSTIGTGYTFTDPYCLTVDGNQNVYVLDRLATTIKVVKIDTAGVATPITLGYTFTANTPRGIAVTSDGASLFIAHATAIRKFTVATGAQAPANIASQGSVNGLAVDGTSVYWTDFSLHSVKKASQDFSTTPTVTVVAGGNTSSTSGFVDGSCVPSTGTARFFNPVNLAILKDPVTGSAKYIYVVDQSNHAIRKIDVGASLVSTVVGATETVTNFNGSTSLVPAHLNTTRGTLGTAGTSGLYFPKGLGITPAGDLIVTSGDSVMQITAPEGQ
ncbi:putative Ig domain-containing protein [Mesoterricola silvestris]|uniref:NHL repeat-containing protein n=1 Tax=Mesoterricola silvestris TaxID=2927979 RepID=A0AA48GKX5_9BACT|nr:putative Ig domain-containing protein [Mesoterricola silvestris]BDU71335.1 hypothetical protein METEAL_05090 [Mesoterricola silvestris]